MTNWIEKHSAKLMSEFYSAIEVAYREKVHEIENAEPTDDDIRQHGHRFIDPDGKTTLTWKGLPVVEWGAMPMGWSADGTKAVITFRKIETKP